MEHLDKAFFGCLCTDPSHQFLISKENIGDDEELEIAIEVLMAPEEDFYKRLITGLKYIFFFNTTPRFADVLLNLSQVKRLTRNLVDLLRLEKKREIKNNDIAELERIEEALKTPTGV